MNVFFFFHLVNQLSLDCLWTAIITLRRCSLANIYIATDNTPVELRDAFGNVNWLKIPNTKNTRMWSKIVKLGELLTQIDGTVLCSDIDVYFKSDPFDNLPGGDVLVTTRHYKHKWPVNGGIFFVRPNPNTRSIFGKEFLLWSNSYANKDWMLDQDYLNFLLKEKIAKDIGYKYNYCPAADLFGLHKASKEIDLAFKDPEIKIIHFKSELKKFALKSPIKFNSQYNWNWFKNG